MNHRRTPILILALTLFLRVFVAPAALSAEPPRVISKGANAGTYQAFPDICRLNSGQLICVFYAGYTHVSLPDKSFPLGGRICAVRSNDEGQTWSAPEILYD